MVVPIPQVSKHVGNSLLLDIPTNRDVLVVIGNHCRVKVQENLGVVKMVGNSSRVTVEKCPGTIEYIGNKGSIFFGQDGTESRVKYSGNGGVISKKDVETCGKEKTKNKEEKLYKKYNRSSTNVVVDGGNVNVNLGSMDVLEMANLCVNLGRTVSFNARFAAKKTNKT